MAVRSLVLVFMVALACWVAAGTAIVYSIHRASVERELLVRIVCEAVLIREENHDPLAPQFRKHYDAILAEAGESCPTKEEP